METEEERFLRFFNEEIAYLRESGKEFAKTHPKIAKRLDFSENESSDPHTERIIESFAYLTAKITKTNDDLFKEVASNLLDILYPHLSNPIPPIGIVKFNYEKSGVIEKGERILATTKEGLMCRFKTVYPVNLLPLEIISSKITSTYEDESIKDWVLQFKFKKHEKIQNLNFTVFINADRVLKLAIYDSIFCQDNFAPILRINGTEKKLSKENIKPMGFLKEEMALPIPKYTTHAYGLIQEYFHFPEKFFFFKIKDLGEFDEDEFELLIPLNDPEGLIGKTLSDDTFLLGCTPIINLFERTTDPIKMDNTKLSYRLVPDQRYENTTEVYSIEGVFETKDENKIENFFSYNRSDEFFWLAKRTSASNRSMPGTDIDIYFIGEHEPVTVYAKTLCTNRFLASELTTDSKLTLEFGGIAKNISLVTKPVEPVYTTSESLLSLVSHLSLNYLGFYEIENLKKLLILLSCRKEHRFYEIHHINKIDISPCVHRLGNEAWRGFVEGLQIDLHLHNPKNTGNSGFLLASVLRQFFALHVDFKSFIKLVLIDSSTSQKKMTFDPLSGEHNLITSY